MMNAGCAMLTTSSIPKEIEMPTLMAAYRPPSKKPAMMALSTNAVGNSIVSAGAFDIASVGAAKLFLVVLIRRHHCAGHVAARSQHRDVTRLSPLLQIATADPVVLHREHARRRPLAVAGEANLAHKGLKLGLVHVIGQLRLVESAGYFDRLLEHLHHGVGVGRQVVTERIDAFLDRALLVLGEE